MKKNNSLKEKVDKFLSSRNVAVIGISTTDEMAPANANYKKLKNAGYNVIPINPKATEYEKVKCYHHVSEVKDQADAALIFTHPEVTKEVARECYDAGIKNVWIHRSFGQGSCSSDASDFMEDKEDVNFIDGACPMMFVHPVDFPHKCIKTFLKWGKRLPN